MFGTLMGMEPHACVIGCWPINRRLLNNRAAPDECWETRSNGDGYTRVGLIDGEQLAHRISWVIHNRRRIPAGYAIHHECGTKSCVNPAHLTLLTQTEHAALHCPPTNLDTPPEGECRHGHDWATHGKLTTQRRWICLECNRDAVRRHDAKRRPKRA